MPGGGPHGEASASSHVGRVHPPRSQPGVGPMGRQGWESLHFPYSLLAASLLRLSRRPRAEKAQEPLGSGVPSTGCGCGPGEQARLLWGGRAPATGTPLPSLHTCTEAPQSSEAQLYLTRWDEAQSLARGPPDSSSHTFLQPGGGRWEGSPHCHPWEPCSEPPHSLGGCW